MNGRFKGSIGRQVAGLESHTWTSRASVTVGHPFNFERGASGDLTEGTPGPQQSLLSHLITGRDLRNGRVSTPLAMAPPGH